MITISEQIFPRPVALISSINKKGKPNVMTASFLMPISFEPKYLAFAIGPERYSFQNLKEVPEFTLNILPKEMKKEAEICGSLSGRKIDKFKKADLEIGNSKKIQPPVIVGSKIKKDVKIPISFECKIVKMEKFGDHFLVVGKVLNEWKRKEKFEPLLHFKGDIFTTFKIL